MFIDHDFNIAPTLECLGFEVLNVSRYGDGSYCIEIICDDAEGYELLEYYFGYTFAN